MLASKKETLKSQLTAETGDVLGQCPELRLVKVADDARDNWTYLTHSLPEGIELVDYFHAAQHLKVAFDAAYGEHTTKADAQFLKYRHIVRDDQDGAEKVIRSLLHLHNKHPRRKQLKTELACFRGHRHRMRYAAAKAEKPPHRFGCHRGRLQDPGKPTPETLQHAMAPSLRASHPDVPCMGPERALRPGVGFTLRYLQENCDSA